MLEMMYAVSVELRSTDVLQMPSFRGMIARWCGVYAPMRFIYHASTSGFLRRQNQNAPSADRSGNSNLPRSNSCII